MIKYCTYSDTYRSIPANYWLASVKDNKLVFDSWDKAIEGKFYFSKLCIIIHYYIIRTLNKLK